jgi:thiol-disulfide isomerase/thioredoxin
MSVLYFYLPGCPHCAALEASPSFTQLQSKVQVTRISNDQTQLTNQYGVSEFPTLILLNNGYEIGRTVGAEDATAILAQTG